MKKMLALFYGGISPEHEVSILSARSVYTALNKEIFDPLLIGISKLGKFNVCTVEELMNDSVVQENKYRMSFHLAEGNPGISWNGTFYSIDCAFPILHGCGGEDGTIQGMFDLAEIPYIGCDMESSVLCMNKGITKVILQKSGIPQVPYQVLFYEKWTKNQGEILDIESSFPYPLFVKPSHGGSSIGTSKAHNRTELLQAIHTAYIYDREILIEKCIVGREIECSVLGNYEVIQASPPGEIIPEREFYDYEAKYVTNDTKLMIPADLPEDMVQKIKSFACKTFSELRCYGMARVDFFLEETTNNLYVNEINTIPGFTAISLYPKLWEAGGLPYRSLVDRLIELALDRKPIRNRMVKGD